MNRLRALLFLVPLLVPACAARYSKIDDFRYWTRRWEIEMGLPPTDFRFAQTPGHYCAQVVLEQELAERVQLHTVTYYDPGRWPCDSPAKLALHEACHRRYQHHRMSQADVEENHIDVEGEAKACAAVYEARLRRLGD